MLKLFQTIFLAIAITLFILPVSANELPQKYNVRYFTFHDGIEEGLINDIIQTRDGLLWFASWNGLYRYDGYTFINYKSGTSRSSVLTHDRLLKLREDGKGYIWVIAYDSTAYCFDTSKDRFIPVCQSEKSNFYDMIAGRNGTMWLLRDDGTAVKGRMGKNGKTIHLQEYNKDVLKGRRINRVFLDNGMREWLLTSKANNSVNCAVDNNLEILFGTNHGKIKIYNLSKKKSRIVQLPTNSDVISIFVSKGRKIYVTKSDGVFVSNNDGKLININYSKGAVSASMPSDSLILISHKEVGVTMVDLCKKKASFVSIKDENGHNINTETGFFDFTDYNSILWIHPNGGPLCYYNNGTLVPFNTTDKEVKWKSNDRCFAAFSDNQGNLWLSTMKDHLKRVTMVKEKFHLYTSRTDDTEMPQNDIRAVYVDKNKNIWTGSRDNYLNIYYPGFRLRKQIKMPRVYAINSYNKGIYWISTKGNGLVRLETDSNFKYTTKSFLHNENDSTSISSNNIYNTMLDSHGRLWIATYGGGINIMYTKEDGNIGFFNHYNQMDNYPIEHYYKVRHIAEDKKGNIWLSTTAGILMIDGNFKSPKEIKYKKINPFISNNPESSNDIQMIYPRKDNSIIAITYGSGVIKLTDLGNFRYSCQTYSKNSGLLSDIIYSIIEDDMNNIWMATAAGMVKFTSDMKSFIQYPIEFMALQIYFNEGTPANDGENLYFCTNRGVMNFNPTDITKSSFAPPLFISSVSVYNRSSVRIAFSALEMTNSEYIRYAYKLEGFDSDFHYSLEGHEANYTNLPPGKYRFILKSTNNEGVWVDNEKSAEITINPTFYQTWIAKILLVLIILLIFGFSLYLYTIFYRIRTKARNEEMLSDLKLKFFTDISHELRTPLTLISAPIAYMLERSNPTDTNHHTLEVIKKNCERMQKLVTDILDFSKIQSNKMRLNLQQKEIVEFVNGIIYYFSAMALRRNITITFTTQIPECVIWIDPDSIEKVIFNIISNAFKYSKDNTIIAISITSDEDNVSIHIKDEGSGIESKNIERIFVRFENNVQKSMKNELSSGIGLSVAAEIVRLHKGKIDVESTPGKGSTFTITLKRGFIHYIDMGANCQPTIKEKEQQSNFTTESNDEVMNLLIVEDNEELNEFIKTIFSGRFAIIQAYNGKEGKEKAIASMPDLIISDIMMPIMDGMQMVKEIKEDERISHIPCILLTAKSDMQNIIEGIETGADDYITKPFNIEFLRAKVDSLLKRRTLLQKYFTLADKESEIDKPALNKGDEVFMNKLDKIMEKELDNPELSVEMLVSNFNLSRTNFFHKLKTITGLSPVLYIRRFRMQRAMSLLKEKEYTISEISYKVGFADPHYFSKIFKSYWGNSPTNI